MQSSSIPSQFTVTWGSGAGPGYIRTVPVPSQIGIQDGAASITTGFPPLNFLPVGSGGVPPFGQDFNGIFQQITAWNQWQGAGGPVFFDSGMSTAIGGYPKWAILASASTAGVLWVSAVENNTANPDSDSTNWYRVGPARVATVAVTKTSTYTVPANCRSIEYELWGGGGGGGGANGGASSGGGGGAYTWGSATVTPGQTIACTIGAGGAFGNAAGGYWAADGGDGGDTIFGAFATAGGGSGGKKAPGGALGAPASGGTGTGGTISFQGGPSGGGMVVEARGGGARYIGSPGGTTFGRGPVAQIAGTTGPHAAAYPGGGGGGSGAATAVVGAAGADGLILIKEYY